MASITFFRHAKAEPPQAGLEDFDRVLAPRGRINSTRMGQFMKQNGLLPELALVSPAARTRETWQLASDEWPDIKVEFDDDIYAASAETLMKVILRHAGAHQSVLVIGHNPALVVLLHQLLERYPPSVNMSYFPTSCVAEIAFEVERLSQVTDESGRLVSFSRVKELENSYGL